MPPFLPKVRLLGWLVVLAMALTACATRTVVTVPVVATRPQSVAKFGPWRMNGRVAIRTREDAWSARLIWTHATEVDSLRLTSAWKQGGLLIDVYGNHLIRVREGAGPAEQSGDVDALLHRKLGFAVPLEALRHWILGLPAPSGAAQPAREGQGEVLRQAGWTIRYQEFIHVSGYELPRRLEVEREGLRLRLVVDRWERGV